MFLRSCNPNYRRRFEDRIRPRTFLLFPPFSTAKEMTLVAPADTSYNSPQIGSAFDISAGNSWRPNLIRWPRESDLEVRSSLFSLFYVNTRSLETNGFGVLHWHSVSKGIRVHFFHDNRSLFVSECDCGCYSRIRG